MEKRWIICAFIAAVSASLTACGSDSGSPQVAESVPYCESVQCPEGTVCNEERQMCVMIPKGNGETNPCDECTDEQECVNDVCVDKEPEPVVNPCDKCTEEQECVNDVCVDKEPEPPVQLCSDTEKPKCNGNAVVSCVEGQYVPKDCENQECKNGKCVDKVDPNKCDPTAFKLTCDQNSVVSCVDGELHSEPCPEGQYCDGGSCFDTDYCPDNPEKMVEGVCGCALPDIDLDENGTIDCLEIEDLCPDDPEKTNPGQCGCGIPETTCGDVDLCPENEGKTVPGICGCEADDTDTDGDGIPDCIDKCPENPYKSNEDTCACELVPVTIDGTSYCAVPIGTAQEFVDLVNGIADESVVVTADSVYAVMRNINLADVLAADTEWKPVAFKGKLVSGGNTIKTIAYTDAEGGRMALHCGDTAESCGLFGTLSGARIDNVKLNYGVSGIKRLGGLAGYADANTKLTGIDATTDIKGAGSDIGGVIGYGAQITLSGITHQGKVVNVGANTSAVPVANTGGIAGRLVSSSVISDSKNSGRVNCESENIDSAASSLGGIVGRAETDTKLFNLVNDGMVTTQTTNYVGGILGYHAKISASGNRNLTNNGYVRGYQYVGGLVGVLEKVNGAEGITDSVNHGTVAGLWQGTGGIAGYSHVPLTRVINHGVVSGSTYIGGISGIQDASANYALNDGMIWGENAQQGCGTYIGGLFGQITGGYEHSNLTNHGQVTADWAPRMAVNGTTGVQSADDCPNRYFAGVVGYISDGSGTKISNVLNTGNITTSMSGLGRSGGIAGWAHSLSLINAKNTGGLKGNSLVGGIVGRLFLRGNSSSKKFPFEWKSVENTGKILSNGDRTGGIIGDLYIENEQTVCSFDQLVNSGTVSSSASRIGGIIGNIKENNKTATFKNLFNSGNIKGVNYVGGIVGFANANTEDFWEGESFRYTATGERTMTYTFDSCVSTGNVTATGSYIGGLFGYVNTLGIAAYAKDITAPNSYTQIDFVKNSYSVARCKGNTNIYIRTIDLQYYNVNSIFNLQNSYFSGNITSTNNGSNVGGLFGQLDTRSEVRTFTNAIRGYTSDCARDDKATQSYTVTRLARANIKNSYSLGTITGEHAYTGRLFGRFLTQDNVADTDAYKKQIMGEGKKTVSTLSNVYSSCTLGNKGSSVAGYQDNITCLTANNVYTWSDGNPGKLIWGNSTSMTGHTAFIFNDAGIPMVGSDKLLDKLKAGASALSLTTWKDANYTLPGNKAVKVPSLDIKPQLTAWEAWEGK